MSTIRWQKALMMTAVAATIGFSGAASARDRDPTLDNDVRAALSQCEKITQSCSQSAQNAVGILVFPNVIKADLIVGGAGGKGALIENGKITGYYNLGAGSVGLQAGVANASQVYIFRTPAALAKLKQGGDWKVGADAGVTLVTADMNVESASGDVLAYVFDAKGLNAGVSLQAFDVWKSDQTRPS